MIATPFTLIGAEALMRWIELFKNRLRLARLSRKRRALEAELCRFEPSLWAPGGPFALRAQRWSAPLDLAFEIVMRGGMVSAVVCFVASLFAKTQHPDALLWGAPLHGVILGAFGVFFIALMGVAVFLTILSARWQQRSPSELQNLERWILKDLGALLPQIERLSVSLACSRAQKRPSQTRRL